MSQTIPAMEGSTGRPAADTIPDPLRETLEGRLRNGWMLRHMLLPGRHTAAFANPQSGKTTLICEAILHGLNSSHSELRRNVVVIHRNHTEDLAQLEARLQLMVDPMVEEATSSQALPGFRVGEATPIMMLDDNQVRKSLEGRSRNRVLQLLSNPAQIERLVRLYDPAAHGDLVVVIDEADQQLPELCGEDGSEDFSKTERALRALLAMATSSVWVSATAVNILAVQRINQVAILDSGPDGRGTSYHSRHDHSYVEADLRALLARKSPRHDEARRAFAALLTADRNPTSRAWGNHRPEGVPGFMREPHGIMLINPGKTRKTHDEVRKLLQEVLPCRDAPTIVVHNDTSMAVHEPQRVRWSCYHVQSKSAQRPQGQTVSNLLTALEAERQADPGRHRHIVVIAGNKAGRGISFVTDDFKRAVTHLVLIASGESGGHDLIQSAGRLCGRFSDGLPRVFAAATDTLASYHAHADVQADFFVALRTQGDMLEERESGALLSIGEEVYACAVADADRAYRFASQRVHRRAESVVQSVAAVTDQEQKVQTLKTAMAANPGYPVLDVFLDVLHRIPDEDADLIHDVTHQRGPATPGDALSAHLAALRATPAIRGRGNRLDEVMGNIGAAAEVELALLKDRLSAGQALSWPSWMPRGRDWSEASLSFLWDRFSAIKGGRSMRNSSHRTMTKGRNLASQNGSIDYDRHHVFMVVDNPREGSVSRGVQPHEIGPRDPARRIGVVVRLTQNVETTVVRELPDGTLVEMTHEQRDAMVAHARQHRSAEERQELRRSIRNQVRGPYICSTGGREVIIRHGLRIGGRRHVTRPVLMIDRKRGASAE